MASGGQIRSTRDGAGCCTLLLRLTPMLADTSPQARAGAGCDRAAFAIDFGAQQATCPQGHASSSWNPVTQRGTETIVITFARGTCGPGSVRSQCTTSASGRRKLTVHPRDVHEARSPPGLPRTPGTSRLDTRCAPVSRAPSAKAWPSPACRYRGLAKTRQEHVNAAATLKLIRLHAWWNGHPLDRTRTSHLARLELALAS